jgi:ABC-type glycerol-3-phosphate transport system substrate-binding protein
VVKSVLSLCTPGTLESLQAVASLYAGFSNGTLTQSAGGAVAGALGASISLEDLARFKELFTIRLIDPPAPDTLELSLLEMGATGTLPDVYMTAALPALVHAGYALPLDDNSALVDFIRGGNCLPTAMNACIIDGSLRAVPYMASSPVLFYNLALATQAGIDPVILAEGMTMKDFILLLPTLSNPTLKQYALFDATPLMSILPSTKRTRLGWATYTSGSFDFDSATFSETVSTLRSIVKNQWTLNHLTEEQIAKNYGTADPRLLGKVAFWVEDSSRIPYWATQSTVQVGFAPLPYLEVPALPLSVHGLCVSPKTADPDVAARFAAFLALDSDSLRLQARFGFAPGMIPMVTEPTLWAECTQKSPASDLLVSFRKRLPGAFIERRLDTNGWSAAIEASIDAYALRLLQGLDSIGAVAKDMNSAAQAAVTAASPTSAAG